MESEVAEVAESIVLPFQLSPAVVESVVHYGATMKSLEKQQEATHGALWSEIRAAYPHLDKDACYSLDTGYLGQGVVMLKGCASCDDKGETPDPIKALLKKALADAAGRQVLTDAAPKSMTDE